MMFHHVGQLVLPHDVPINAVGHHDTVELPKFLPKEYRGSRVVASYLGQVEYLTCPDVPIEIVKCWMQLAPYPVLFHVAYLLVGEERFQHGNGWKYVDALDLQFKFEEPHPAEADPHFPRRQFLRRITEQ